MNVNEQPLVSVIIPTYNRRNMLPVSLNSVLMQTYDNLEVIIVDDGSDDGTDEYVRELTDSRIKYVKGNGNNGPSAARNLGVKLARGEYVAFQDSDDEWLPDKLEKQMRLFREHSKGTGMVYCEFVKYFGQTEMIMPSKEIPYEDKQGQIFRTLLLTSLIGTPTIVVRRQEFINVGGFNEKLKSLEDYEFTLRFSRYHNIGFVEETLVIAHDSPDSVDKQYADAVHTWAYTVREMISPLREYGFLWEKLSEMKKKAEQLMCQEVFIEELRRLMDLFVTEQEKRNVVKLIEKTEQGIAKRELDSTKKQILKAYLSIYNNNFTGTENLIKAIRQTLDSTIRRMETFEIPSKLRSSYEQIQTMENPSTKVDRLLLLTDMVKIIEVLENFIEQKVYEYE